MGGTGGNGQQAAGAANRHLLITGRRGGTTDEAPAAERDGTMSRFTIGRVCCGWHFLKNPLAPTVIFDWY